MLNLAVASGMLRHQLSDISVLAKYNDIEMNLLIGPRGSCHRRFEDDKRHKESGYRIAISTPYLSSNADGILKHL